MRMDITTVIIDSTLPGRKMQRQLVEHLLKNGCTVKYASVDCYWLLRGDYSKRSKRLCRKLLDSRAPALGILIGYYGIEMAVAACKVKGIRAVVCRDVNDVEFARRTLDANVLCISGIFSFSPDGYSLAREMVDAFLLTRFSGKERDRRALAEIAKLET